MTAAAAIRAQGQAVEVVGAAYAGRVGVVERRGGHGCVQVALWDCEESVPVHVWVHEDQIQVWEADK